MLLTGKVTMEFADEIQFLIENKLAVPPKFITDSYAENNNTDKRINFILDHLK